MDTLIVGQGLAGSLLAWTLRARGQRVMVLDDGHHSAASVVAAGLLNPITGQRLVKGLEVDHCLPHAQRCYRALEAQLARPLLHLLPMWRLFQHDREKQAWEKRCGDPAYAAYLGEALAPMDHPRSALGGFVQTQTGYLDTRALLDGLRAQLEQEGAYRQCAFDYAQLVVQQGGVAYQDLQARRLIFCEGWRALSNPWFADLPLRPARGCILTLHSEAPLSQVILNQGRWLLPRGQGEYRLGASYDREALQAKPGEAEIDGLLGQLESWFAPVPDYRVSAVQNGVRPNSRDRQPLLGLHPDHAALGVFNGFGSCGAMLIPWHAERMAELLCEGKPLPASLDWRRA